MKHIVNKTLCIVFLAILLVGCAKEDDYKEFIKDGTKTYPGKALDLKASPGKYRVVLSWTAVDTKIARYLVSWNNKRDSLVVPAKNTGDVADSISLEIKNLQETDYLFTVTSFDKLGNRSITEEVKANVYGDIFAQAALSRGFKNANSIDGVAILKWSNSSEGEVGVEINYTNKNNGLSKVIMAATDTVANLVNFKNGSTFSYRTLYLPDSLAIDTVSTTLISDNKVSYPPLDKARFAVRKFPTDMGDAWGWPLNYLWDNNLAEGRGFHTPEVAFPYHFTFDLGVTTVLSEMKIWQRQSQLYDGANPRYFEVWGSANPPDDGSWTGWTRILADGESIKPSGRASGYTPEDEVYAKSGELFRFNGDAPEVRYIRFKIFGNWANRNPGATHIMEVTFWGN